MLLPNAKIKELKKVKSASSSLTDDIINITHVRIFENAFDLLTIFCQFAGSVAYPAKFAGFLKDFGNAQGRSRDAKHNTR